MPVASTRHLLAVAGTAALVIAVAACDSEADSGSPDQLDVVASFYPLQYVVERIGGDRVHVDNLTPAGAEPHDLELTAEDAARLESSDLVVYLGGFSPAVDESVQAVAADHAMDVASFAGLDLRYQPIDEGEQHDAATDPHFWLDPIRLGSVAEAVAARLTAADPDGAATFQAGAQALQDDLGVLDRDSQEGLTTCRSRDIVTTHNAFGYLADRYQLVQVGITGLTPEDEPTPRDLADTVEFVERNDVTTIYYETLVSPTIARTIASETGASTAVLDPIEGLTSTSAGSDYLEIMRSNLETLRAGQGCT